ncbi:DUF5719 family protein [Salinibacterium sp. ZJ70]|uniref:DUF5719 family protein n=1 Tax=Salinibacterium sp. ZJ70 TaxID=2708084 RepID=UPI001423D159|nr:DUF5719 family protein [Salinibacterium sp. ZJ70]
MADHDQTPQGDQTPLDQEHAVEVPADASHEDAELEPQAAADTEPESAAGSADPTPSRTVSDPRGRDAAMVSLRVARGLVGLGLAAALVAGVGLATAPAVSIAPLATTVDPEPADLLRACAGPLLRLGDASGANAGQSYAVGAPDVIASAIGGDVVRASAGEAAVLNLPAADGAALAGTQSQLAAGGDGLEGLAVASCVEPASSAWLVGGANATGRTTLLVLTNPTEVPADVTVQLWGESGSVSAPGMSGLRVAPGSQRVIPLAGYAPELISPVVRVTARGGQVAATLQTSVIRVLDPGGADIVAPSAAPATRVVVPGVRIFDTAGVSGALGRLDHEDLDAIARVGNPGTADAEVEISVRPAGSDGFGTSFQIEVPAGRVVDVALTAGLALGEGPLADGTYTVSFASEVPVVAGVRASTTPAVPEGSTRPGPIDLAWFPSATALRGDTLIATAAASSPVLTLENPDDADRTVTIESQAGAAPLEVVVPAAGSAAVALAPGTGYLLREVSGMRVGVSYARTGELAAQSVRSPRQAESSIVVRP